MSHEANVGIEHVEKKLGKAKDAKRSEEGQTQYNIVWALIKASNFNH